MSAAKIALLGAPHDANSSFMRGPADAPDRIRRVLRSDAGNAYSEAGINVLSRLEDLGDLDAADTCAGVMQFREGLRPLVVGRCGVISLGGDHSVTYPLALAVAEHHGPLDVLHFDAHGDVYPDFGNNPYSHASPFARLLESGQIERLVQVGIRTLTPEQKTVIDHYKVESHQWRGDVNGLTALKFERPVYVSIDIDALDPAFAPGVSHHEPGGMSVRQVLQVLQGVQGQVVAGDIVEYNPRRDVHDLTAAVCVKFVKELAGKILGSTGLSN